MILDAEKWRVLEEKTQITGFVWNSPGIFLWVRKVEDTKAKRNCQAKVCLASIQDIMHPESSGCRFLSICVADFLREQSTLTKPKSKADFLLAKRGFFNILVALELWVLRG